MNKMIFVNASNPNCINYDLSKESSWGSSTRLNALKKTGDKIPVCLLGLNTAELPKELMPSLARMSDWADLYTSDFRMKDGFHPLLLDGKELFFTDVNEYSMMDRNWAIDNVYKMQFPDGEKLVFEKYELKSPESNGWQQGIIAAQSLRIKDLFNVVKKTFPSLDGFFQAHQNADVEITYCDKHVRTEFSMNICLNFIKDIEEALKPSKMKVDFIGLTFQEPNANSEGFRRLTDSYLNDAKRDEKGGEMINDNRYTFVSKRKDQMPHYRELLIKATKDGKTHTLRIMPDAGLAHWGFDIGQQREDRRRYNANSGLNPEIPITSSTEQVYYICIQ